MTVSLPRLGAAAADVVRQAADGDEAAFTSIVAAHHDDMVRVSFVVCGDADLAEEAVASAWLVAWRKLGDLREPERLRPWLVSIAANEARQAMRRQRRRGVVDLTVADAAATSGDPAARTTDIDLANALGRYGITANAVRLGFVDSERFQARVAGDEEHRQRMVDATATRRIPTPSEVARCIAPLFGEAS